MELLRSRTGQNVIKFPLCSEEEKLAILIEELGVCIGHRHEQLLLQHYNGECMQIVANVCSGWLFQLSLEVPPPLMFPMTVTPLGRDQDCSLKNREPDVPALLVPGSWRLEQDRRGWTVLHLPWNLYPVPLPSHPPPIYGLKLQRYCYEFEGCKKSNRFYNKNLEPDIGALSVMNLPFRTNFIESHTLSPGPNSYTHSLVAKGRSCLGSRSLIHPAYGSWPSSYLIALARTLSTTLNRYGKNRQLYLIPDFSGITLSFSPFILMLAIGLLYTAFIIFGNVHERNWFVILFLCVCCYISHFVSDSVNLHILSLHFGYRGSFFLSFFVSVEICFVTKYMTEFLSVVLVPVADLAL
ncbi:hypothetical protein STEG23_034670 [Scotinomys teguina]